MHKLIRLMIALSTVAAAVLTLTLPLSAQAPSGLMADLLKDLASVEKKVMELAKAMPESAWTWRPAGDAAVRSTGEVFQHIAADNYLLPVLGGAQAPAETGITKDYKTVQAYEKKTMAREATITELAKSFAFLRASMSASEAKLEAPIDMFGQKNTTRGLWITTLTHLHEHLGQLIAYARSNKVTPPWSK
jgi:hypothetical protein